MHISRSTNYTQVIKTPTCFGAEAPSSRCLKYNGAQAPIHQSATPAAAAAAAAASVAAAIGIVFCNC